MLPLRVRRGPLGSVDAALARWLSVEWSARLLAYSMRPSGVSRYVIVRVFVLFRHAPFLADRRLRGCVINHYAVERPLVKGLNELPLRRVPAKVSQAGLGATPRREQEAAAQRAPSERRHATGYGGWPPRGAASGSERAQTRSRRAAEEARRNGGPSPGAAWRCGGYWCRVWGSKGGHAPWETQPPGQ
jgi:hypothetical protein